MTTNGAPRVMRSSSQHEVWWIGAGIVLVSLAIVLVSMVYGMIWVGWITLCVKAATWIGWLP